jgi:hypothetical protein
MRQTMPHKLLDQDLILRHMREQLGNPCAQRFLDVVDCCGSTPLGPR